MGRIGSLLTKHEINQKNARLMAELAMEADLSTPMRPLKATPAGDEERLRGVPVQARGVGGAIPGTRP